MKKWYGKETSANQGLVIEEDTGRDVAVTYDVKDMQLVAAAPDLLAACKLVIDAYDSHEDDGYDDRIEEAVVACRHAFYEAT